MFSENLAPLNKVRKQSQIDKEVNKTEAIVSFTESVLEFMKQEPGDALDMPLAKLEAPKTMLEPTIENALNEDFEFYQLIQIVKSTKDAIENLNTNIGEVRMEIN